MSSSNPQLQQQNQKVLVPVSGNEYFRNHGNTMDMNYWNCYPEVFKNPHSGETRTVLTKRPGTQKYVYSYIQTDIWAGLGLDDSTMNCVANISIQQLTGEFLSVWVNVSTATAYVLRCNPITGANTLVGTIAKISGLSAALNSNDFFSINEVQIVSGGVVYPGITVTRTSIDRSVSTAWYAISNGTNFTAASLTQITAAGFPDQRATPKVVTGKIVQLNGIFHVMCTDGEIASSGGTGGTANDITQWSASAVLQTYQHADVGVGLERYKHHVVAFSNSSIEFFNDVGNPPVASPLERTEQAYVKFGSIINPRCIHTIKDTLYWISSGQQQAAGVWKMDGYEPVKISNSKIDKRISINRVGDYLSNMSMFSITLAGKVHIGINGVKSIMMPYHSGAATKFGISTDTCYSQEGLHLLKYMVSGIILYSVDDNVWWNWTVAKGAYNGGVAVSPEYTGILPAPLVYSAGSSTSLASNFYADTHCLFLTRTQSATAHVMNDQNEMMVINPKDSTSPAFNSGGYFDELWNNAQGELADGKIPIMAGVGFELLTFGTMARKRVNRIELMFADVPQQDTAAWDVVSPYFNGSYSISLFYDRLNNHNYNDMNYQKGTIERTMQYRGYGLSTNTNQTSLNVYGLPDRYFVNNLGMCRYLNLFIACQTYDPFPLEFLEIHVEEGTD